MHFGGAILGGSSRRSKDEEEPAVRKPGLRWQRFKFGPDISTTAACAGEIDVTPAGFVSKPDDWNRVNQDPRDRKNAEGLSKRSYFTIRW